MQFCTPLLIKLLTKIICLAGLSLVGFDPIANSAFSRPIAPSDDPNQPGTILKTPKNTAATDLKKLNNALKPKVKYSVVKSCNQ